MASAKSGKVIEKTFRDDDMMRLFNQMIGASEPDPAVVIPKMQSILKSCDTILSVLEKSFLKSPFAAILARHYAHDVQEIADYCLKGRRTLAEHQLEKNDGVRPDLVELNRDRDRLMQFIMAANHEYVTEGLGEKYKSLESSALLQNVVMTLKRFKEALTEENLRNPPPAAKATPESPAPATPKGRVGKGGKAPKASASAPASSSNLAAAAASPAGASSSAPALAPEPAPPRHCLDNRDALSIAFIANSVGDSLPLFSFSRLDFKQIYLQNLLDANLTKYLLQALYLIYRETHNIVENLTRPNVDVEELGRVIISNIESIEGQVPGCEKAFSKIRDSLELFKGNFGGYYKDFLSAKSNPWVILESYIHDVANTNAGDKSTVAQFGKIIKFYRERMKVTGTKDPMMAKMMRKAEEQMALLETSVAKKDNKATAAAAV